jgi:putative membrane protein
MVRQHTVRRATPRPPAASSRHVTPSARRNRPRFLSFSRGALPSGLLRPVLIFGVIGATALFAEHIGLRLHFPAGAFEVAGAIIALALTFRYNTAYNRFWEGRTLWGAIVNASRNLARLLARYPTRNPDAARGDAAWIVAFAHATRRTLREQHVYPELEGVLAPEEIEALRTATHPALYAADQLSRRIAALQSEARLDPMLAALAEREVEDLVNNLGGCERIHKTPTPRGFVLLIQWLLLVYLASLPFVLVGRVGLATPLLTMIVSYPILLIEALGAELDDPFGHGANHLPLARICSTIQKDLLGFAPPPERVHTRNGDDD